MDLVLWSSLKFGQVGDRVQKPKNFVVVICTWLQRGRRGPEWTPTDPPQAHFYGCHAMPFLPSSAKIVEQIFHPRKRALHRMVVGGGGGVSIEVRSPCPIWSEKRT